MNQENKGVKSNEVCKLCKHQECVCKEEWSGMHPLVSNLAIMEAVEHLYSPSFFTEQSLEEKLECKNPCENKNCEIHSLEGNKHNPYLGHPHTDSKLKEEFAEYLRHNWENRETLPVAEWWLNKMKEQREKMIEEINSLFHEVQQDLMPLGNEDWKEGYNKALYDVLAIIKNKE